MIKLEVPSVEHKKRAIEYRNEHFASGEKVINGSELFDQIENYEEWLARVNANASAQTVDPNWVVTDTFFAVESETGEIVGIIDFRHQLKGFLKDFGHCGYSVRPSCRNRGYATQMLKILLAVAKNAGLSQLQLSVEENNAPSVRTIVKNGGKKVRSFQFEGGIADVYLVDL